MPEPLTGDGTPYERRAGLALALLAALLVALGVAPELRQPGPDLNDSVLHVALTLRADEALARGESPVDFWHPDVGMGYPVFRHYQHLPHLVLVAAKRALLSAVPIEALYRTALGALLALFPLSIFLASRRLGLAPVPAGCAALAAPLLSTPHLYGLSFESYLWAGSGLYTQLFASVLAPLAISETAVAVREGRGTARAAALLGATFLSHLVYGYLAALSSLALLVPAGDRPRRAARLLAVYAAAFLAASYFLVPALRDGTFANHSVWEPAFKWDSLGAEATLGHLVSGELFDRGRLPVLTAFLGLGLVVAVRHGGERLLTLAGLFAGWLALYFGRATWGLLLDALPLARDIPLHRFIGAVHLFALPLCGVGLYAALRAVGFGRSLPRSVLAYGALAVVLLPAARERAGYLASSERIKREHLAALARDPHVEPLLARLEALQRESRGGGRAFVGLGNEALRAGGIPLSAFCLGRGIDSLGFLWHSMTLAGDVQLLFDASNETHCRAFGVRWIVSDRGRAPAPFARPLEAIGPWRIDEVPGASRFAAAEVPLALEATKRTAFPVGRAWLAGLAARDVHPALALPRGPPPPAVLARAALDPDDPAQVRALAAGREAPPPPPGRVVRGIDRFAADVVFDRPGALVLRDGAHPGLRASVDGRDAAAFAVAPGFAAVLVPAGAHEVRFRYEPTARWPLLLAGALGLLLAGRASRALAAAFERLAPSARSPAPSAARGAALVLGLALLAGRPLLHEREMAGHDSRQYLTQLVEFDRCVRDGQVPPLWAPDLNGGRGIPLFAFYPPLLLAAAEALHLAGLSLVASMNLAVLGFLALAGLLMFLFARERWGERAGVVAAAAYLFASYVLLDVYVRHAFLEVAALPWLPLIAWGVARGAPARIAAGAALVFLSQPLFAPLFFPCALVYALACRTLRPALGGLALGAALAAWFILPAALERKHLMPVPIDYADHFVTLGQVLWSPWGFGLSVPGTGDGMAFRLGLPLLLALAGALTLARTRETVGLALAALLAIVLATPLSEPLWSALPPLRPVQFPWRALAVATFAAAALAGAVFGRFPRTALVAILALGLPLAAPRESAAVNERALAPQAIAERDLQPGTGGIFHPREAPLLRPGEPPPGAAVLEGRAEVLELELRTDRARLIVSAATPARVRLDVNDFPGWRAARWDGGEVPIDRRDGLIVLALPAGYHFIDVWFGATPAREAGKLVSILALAALAAGWIFGRRAGAGATEGVSPMTTLAEDAPLSVVVPCLNEERRLGRTLDDLAAYTRAARRPVEVIVVDDGSTDGTADLARARAADFQDFRLIRHERNTGKGHAVRTGMLAAKGELRAFADADGAVPFADLDRLIAAVQAGAAIAVGSRVLDTTLIETRPHRRLAGAVFRAIVKTLAVRTVEDTQCGFKLFRAAVARRLFENQLLPGFAFDVEALYRAERAGLKIAEVPVHWRDQPGSKVHVVRDGLRMLRDVIRLRLRVR